MLILVIRFQFAASPAQCATVFELLFSFYTSLKFITGSVQNTGYGHYCSYLPPGYIWNYQRCYNTNDHAIYCKYPC